MTSMNLNSIQFMAHKLRYPFLILAFLGAMALVYSNESLLGPFNGFDLSDPLIPADEIHHGGPGRDGIPSIDVPVFIDATKARFLSADDAVLGLSYKGETRAYPIRILNWHEIVNDKIAGDALVVSYCPLCGTGTVFSADLNGQTSRFGVSGLLYNSDLLLYDEATESLWSQILGKAITGPLKGRKMSLLPAEYTTWADWRQRHPDTQVLSTDTGYSRNYQTSPYGNYDLEKTRFFPVAYESRRYHPKERVIGVEINGQFKAYAFPDLPPGKGRLEDRFAGQRITLIYNTEARSGSILGESGEVIPTINAFWFAWYGFHPDTDLFKPLSSDTNGTTP